VYREAMTHQAACNIILAGSGSHFDPDVVAAFLELSDSFARISRALADEQECSSARITAHSADHVIEQIVST
jgi:putative two-component system response regulator